MPWGFFDGASQNNLCGGGAILFFSEHHFFELMVGLGEGSKNSAELPSLKILLMFAAEKGCRNLNIFGDSMNVINWIKGIQHCQNIRLENILSSFRAIIDTYVLAIVNMFTGRTTGKQTRLRRRGFRWKWTGGRLESS